MAGVGPRTDTGGPWCVPSPEPVSLCGAVVIAERRVQRDECVLGERVVVVVVVVVMMGMCGGGATSLWSRPSSQWSHQL